MDPAAQPTATLDLLHEGELEILGRLTDATNATFLCRVSAPGRDGPDTWPDDDPWPSATCVYKPTRGERPLADFPVGTLGQREVAAYLVSEASGWGIVPPTLMRDGPFGPGMVQAWIEVDPDADVVELVMAADDRLRSICVFDALVNNADRKGSHLLPLPSGEILGVDHGICFAVEPKLRTVLWAWRGELLAPAELVVLHRLRAALDENLGAALGELLSRAEVDATTERAEALITSARLPEPDPDRPAVPWPPF